MRAFVLRVDLDGAIAWEVTRPVVLIAGSGIWTGVLSRLVDRSGGCAVVREDPRDVPHGEALPCVPVVVAGPPLAPADLVALTVRMRDAGVRTIAVLSPDAPDGLADDLRLLGAAAVETLDEDLRAIVSAIAVLGNFPIRQSPRGILLSPVLLRSGRTLHAAIAVDVSEGGLGIETADPHLIRSAAEAQFHLPGSSVPITVAVAPAWVEEGGRGRVRAGLKFLDLDAIDRAAIRAFQADAVPAPALFD